MFVMRWPVSEDFFYCMKSVLINSTAIYDIPLDVIEMNKLIFPFIVHWFFLEYPTAILFDHIDVRFLQNENYLFLCTIYFYIFI